MYYLWIFVIFGFICYAYVHVTVVMRGTVSSFDKTVCIEREGDVLPPVRAVVKQCNKCHCSVSAFTTAVACKSALYAQASLTNRMVNRNPESIFQPHLTVLILRCSKWINSSRDCVSTSLSFWSVRENTCCASHWFVRINNELTQSPVHRART